MRVLVTGANGFLGKAIVRKLSDNNFKVQALVNRGGEFGKTLAVEKFFQADVRDFKQLEKLENAENVDAIVHAAGLAHQFGKRDDGDFWRTNVLGTRNVAELGAKWRIKHFILISSVAVYGGSGKNGNAKEVPRLAENFECRPAGIYAQSKFEAEKAAREICEKNRITLTVLRPATIIGEEDRGNVARLITTIDKKRFIWIGKGENYKSLIYKDDVAEACLRILQRKSASDEIYDVYNVAAEALKMREVVSEIYESLGKTSPRFSISESFFEKVFRLNRKFLHIGKVENLAATVEKWLADDAFSAEKLQRECGFRALTPIREAIRREVEDYKKHKK